jgi:hypothetical protein
MEILKISVFLFYKFSVQFRMLLMIFFFGTILGLSQQVVTDCNATLPRGAIIAFSGDIYHLPPGWYPCNGMNGTPDLRARFIVAADDTNYRVNDRGGKSEQILTSSHLPPHTHDFLIGQHRGTPVTPPVTGFDTLSFSTYSYVEETVNMVHSTGSGVPIDTRPPYYALYYIMWSGIC